jgi:hypothetical protein
MSGWWQLVVVLVVVAMAALYAGRHIWKQTRVADPDFSANGKVGCGSCPAARSYREPRNQG